MKIIRVVVADRHPMIRLGLRAVLESLPEIEIAGETDHAEEALRLALALRPEVLILGMNLPAEESLAVARQLHEAGSATRVLALSTREEERHLFEMLAWRVAGYLSKAETSEAIIAAIRGVASGEMGWLSHSITARLAEWAKSEADAAAEVLSKREREVLRLMATGHRNQHIADALYLSPDTIKNHLTRIYGRLGVHTRADAVVWAWRHGLVQES